MFLRDLTDEEIEKIKRYKDSANKVIKAHRKKLQAEIKVLWKSNPTFDKKREKLERQLEDYAVVTGRPVIIKVGYEVITLNYDLLKKYERSLDKSNLRWSSVRIDDNSLIIRYEKHDQSGTIELYELPAHQVDLLDGLPTIELMSW